MLRNIQIHTQTGIQRQKIQIQISPTPIISTREEGETEMPKVDRTHHTWSDSLSVAPCDVKTFFRIDFEIQEMCVLG